MNKEKEKTTVLVTGANGFIGSHLSLALTKKRYSVIGLIFGRKKVIPELKNNKHFRPVSGDIRDFEKILNIFKKYRPQGVFHTAAVIPASLKTNNPFIFFETNTKGTLNILEACQLSGVKRFVFSSTMEVYDKDIKELPVSERHPLNPVNFYGKSKLLGEQFCKFYSEKYGLKTVILRYSGIYGQGRKEGAVFNFMKSALSNSPLEIYSNLQWDIVYVKDVVLANIRAFERADKFGFEIINIGSGKAIDIKDLAKTIIEMVDSDSKIKLHKELSSSCFYFNIKKAKLLLNFSPLPLKQSLYQYFLEIKKTKA